MGIEVASSFTRKSPVPLDDSRSVADLAARDAIASGIRYIGMDVFVASEGVWYTLIGGITNGDWQESSGSGGGGGGAIEWQSLSNGALANQEGPLGLEYEFTYELGQTLTAYLKVPSSYKAGKPISIRGSFYLTSVSNNFKFELKATLIKDGVTALNSTANQNTDSIEVAVPATSTAPLGLIFNISTDGKINSVDIGIDDIIILELKRIDTGFVGTPTTGLIKFLPQTTEVTYV